VWHVGHAERAISLSPCFRPWQLKQACIDGSTLTPPVCGGAQWHASQLRVMCEPCWKMWPGLFALAIVAWQGMHWVPDRTGALRSIAGTGVVAAMAGATITPAISTANRARNARAERVTQSPF
jgi:hypothetical protein